MNYTDKLIKEYLKEDVVEFPKEILNDVTDLRGTPSYGKTDYRCPKCGSRDVKVLGQDTGADPAEAADGTGIGYSHCENTLCYCNECWTYFKHIVCTTTTISTEEVPVERFFLCFYIDVDIKKQTLYTGSEEEILNAFYKDLDTLSAYCIEVADPSYEDGILLTSFIPGSCASASPILVEVISALVKEPPKTKIDKLVQDALNKDNNLEKVISFLNDKNKLKDVGMQSSGEDVVLFDTTVDNGACGIMAVIASSVNSDENGIIL